MGNAGRHGLLFEASGDTYSEIESTHDLLWCAAISMWNTRAQVVGLRSLAPNIDQPTLVSRLAAGSGLVGSNAVTATDRYSWDDQLSEVAMIRLLLIQAQFEGWLEGVATHILPGRSQRAWVKAMTFPTTHAAALAGLGRSTAMENLFAASRPHAYRIDAALAPAIVCLRYFKEVRNAAIHSGRRANAALLEAQTEYDGVVSAGVLASAYRPPAMQRVSGLGDRVVVSHHGVIGLTGLVQRVIATLDARIAMSQAGEQYYLAKWARLNPFRELPGDSTKRARQLRNMAGRVGPVPLSRVASWETMLKRSGLVRY